MKKQIIIIGMLVLMVVSVTAYVCQDETDIGKIPCEVITPVIGFSGCCNATIIDLNNTTTNMTLNITANAIGDGTYNFSFNYTNLSSYSIVLCENSSSTMNVGHFESGRNILSFFLIIPLLLLTFGILMFTKKVKYQLLKSFTILLSFVPMIAIFQVAIVSAQEYINSPRIITAFNRFYWAFLFIFLLLFIFMLVSLIVISLDLLKKRKGLK